MKSTNATLIFFSGPYQSESAETTINLAQAAIQKGIDVKIFCYMAAVNCVQTGQKKVPGVTNIEEQFADLITKGVDVRLCTLCMLVRGVKAFVDGAKRGGTPDIADMVDESDRVLLVF